MIKWSAIDISWCMISNQPVGSSLDTQPTAAVRRASILTHTNMGVFQSNYTDFVGIFMKEQWERLREHMPKIMIHGLFKDCFHFPPLLGLISTRMDWKHQPVEGLFINWWKCVTWGGGFLILSDSDWVGLDRVLTISMEWATLQPCFFCLLHNGGVVTLSGISDAGCYNPLWTILDLPPTSGQITMAGRNPIWTG